MDGFVEGVRVERLMRQIMGFEIVRDHLSGGSAELDAGEACRGDQASGGSLPLDEMVRTVLYEAANVLLSRVTRSSAGDWTWPNAAVSRAQRSPWRAGRGGRR